MPLNFEFRALRRRKQLSAPRLDRSFAKHTRNTQNAHEPVDVPRRRWRPWQSWQPGIYNIKAVNQTSSTSCGRLDFDLIPRTIFIRVGLGHLDIAVRFFLAAGYRWRRCAPKNILRTSVTLV